jgi:pyruvate dehydrogenase E2 component (dihydrolipoamide acetyltransferase)
MAVEVFMPKMSDHMEVGIIIGWLAKEGDKVDKGQPILELETDKAAVELEAPDSGILKGIRLGVEAGANVPVGETIAFIARTPDETVPALPPLDSAIEKSEVKVEESAATPSLAGEGSVEEAGPVRAAPAVRRIARDLGIDLEQVKGSGPGGRIIAADVHAFAVSPKQADLVPEQVTELKTTSPVTISPVALRMAEELGVDLAQVKATTTPGRITKEDVRAYLASAGAPLPVPENEDGSEWLDLTRTQLVTGQRMVESVLSAPQFVLTTSVDMTRTLELREAVSARIESESGARPSMTSILVRIVADALKRYPRANASYINGRVKLYKQVNIGVAIGTEEGLVVPVIHDADRKSLAEITRELKLLQERASRMRFGPDDLSGGTFTISNLGMFGVDQFHAIINPPESAIMAVGRIIKTPIGMPDDSIALRPIMNITLSIDHRSLDGMQGAKFLALVKACLEQPYLII